MIDIFDQFNVASKLGADICLSGGASGADRAWGLAAEKANHTVVHWSFKGHKPSTNKNIFILDDEELKEADPYLEKANKSLKRRIPYKKPWILNLLRRNWYQIKYTDAVYAVSEIEDWAFDDTYTKDHEPGTSYNMPMGVKGGTGWACQMYFDRWMVEHTDRNLHPIESGDLAGNPALWFPWFKLYVFDQKREQAYKWIPHMTCWVKVDDIPTPSGTYTGIGTRDLTEAGQAWIDSLYIP